MAIPLFTYRKRQREAVLSDPFQISTVTDVSDSANPPKYGNPALRNNGEQKQSTQFNNSRSNTLRNYSSSHSVKDTPLQLMPNSHSRSTNNFQQTSTNFSKAVNRSFGRGTNFNEVSTVSSAVPYRNSMNGNFQHFDTYNNPATRNANRNRSFVQGNNSMPDVASKSGLARVPSVVTSSNPNRFSETRSTNIYKQREFLEMPKGGKVINEWNPSVLNAEKVLKSDVTSPRVVPSQTMNKTSFKKSEKDSSMQIFTCSISSMKSWASCNITDIMVMFEIYGLVDSATLRDSSGTGKEFILRDDTSSIKCIFYEIDRELPRLIRGQVYRVVGLMRKDLLQVVHVRSADKEERQVCILASQVSQREMEQVIRTHNEQ
ncbi:spermatogenesis-associated protein 22-like isoform X1 [Biomphalaria glabrata]|uniref:Spermatogenesis-associated protein 22-like isoform X1 n=2 Tax=Biomphalaria glabrata TaxID=6526 RepID=A0A9U8DY64_BIOGL|nr:spermatogenesis-associated protein 22-like isoform X1 [Biomphalaria glabrata]XP_013065424.2 spermatogenesis-associated protein 22-like isoform X1 [Biomphalaria glabrata]XP_013065427.2 spermatogenesis-associated protein 22-like isoform X1 [Biomphalaria glabrata]XP_013065428.2 spermatogenesis-associated protein 22-like isoform X1 [Biomphalaria glabrata]XP_055863243.1 spermatogenesis-associated protein 22-like isoform X1 [Biomphalaria glabrata]